MHAKHPAQYSSHLGCGLNVLNAPPLGSLLQLKLESSTLTTERTAALIMARFGPMWDLFVNERGSFEPFLKLYLERWMHSYVSCRFCSIMS